VEARPRVAGVNRAGEGTHERITLAALGLELSSRAQRGGAQVRQRFEQFRVGVVESMSALAHHELGAP
jgi:hypothetical protein